MDEIIDIAKVNKINQITNPKAVRELLDVNPEDKLILKEESKQNHF